MVRCTEYLRIFKEDNVIENAANVGKLLLDGLIEIEQQSNGKISNCRGRGMFIAFDLPDTDLRNKMVELLREEGVLVLSSGEKSIRLRPPLTMTPQEAQSGLGKFKQVLNSI
jgi:L-lysine 6-transaminase